MASIRQSRFDTLSRDYPHGHRVALHRHVADQLLYASSGTMTVTADDGAWVIPPQRAVWIPAGMAHRIAISGQVRMRTLYISPGRAFRNTRRCRVLGIAPLDRELILELVRTPRSMRDAKWQRLSRVLLDRLTSVPTMPLHLPAPRDPRARRAARAIGDDPASARSLATLSRRCGASERTLARLFLEETGMTFGRWRQQARLLSSLRLLAAGRSVTTVALEVGYDSPSAFIAMFRRTLGVSPGRYFSVPALPAR